jgi:hypothetical protein
LYKTSFMPSPQPFDLSVAGLRQTYASKFANCLAGRRLASSDDKLQMTNDKSLLHRLSCWR